MVKRSTCTLYDKNESGCINAGCSYNSKTKRCSVSRKRKATSPAKKSPVKRQRTKVTRRVTPCSELAKKRCMQRKRCMYGGEELGCVDMSKKAVRARTKKPAPLYKLKDVGPKRKPGRPKGSTSKGCYELSYSYCGKRADCGRYQKNCVSKSSIPKRSPRKPKKTSVKRTKPIKMRGWVKATRSGNNQIYKSSTGALYYVKKSTKTGKLYKVYLKKGDVYAKGGKRGFVGSMVR